MRFEDIKENPYPVLKQMLEFIFKVEDISGTKLHARLLKVVESKPPEGYKVRKGKSYSNQSYYTGDDLDRIYNQMKNVLQKLKYAH